jgi:hypothetical protein
MTLICFPLLTASNASFACVMGYVTVMRGFKSTTPRFSISIAEGKHDAVYRVIPIISFHLLLQCEGSPLTSSSLFVTAMFGNTEVWTWFSPTCRTAYQLSTSKLGGGDVQVPPCLAKATPRSIQSSAPLASTTRSTPSSSSRPNSFTHP